jgi:hypothetical protein
VRARSALAAILVAAVACTAATPERPRDGARGGSSRSEDARPGGGRGTGPPGTGGSTRTSTPPRERNDDGPVGSYGAQLLNPAVSRAVIEIDSSGPQLSQRARDGLVGALQEHGGKQVSFAAAGSAPNQETYTAEDLRRIADQTRETASRAGSVAVHVLVLDGQYEDQDALGVAFEASTFAIFPSRIRSGLLSSVNYGAFEEAVVVHELGHLFGLVDLTGHGAFHEDAEHPGHSANQGSVMYWAVEDVSIANVFRGGPPTEFDADDRREMDRIRG